MTLFRVDAYVAHTRFRAWAGEPLGLVGMFVVTSDAADLAAEAVFHIGNRQGPDVHGQLWPSTTRSMSVGDVVCVHTPDGPAWFACDSIGWRAIPPNELDGVELTTDTQIPWATATSPQPQEA